MALMMSLSNLCASPPLPPQTAVAATTPSCACICSPPPLPPPMHGAFLCPVGLMFWGQVVVCVAFDTGRDRGLCCGVGEFSHRDEVVGYLGASHPAGWTSGEGGGMGSCDWGGKTRHQHHSHDHTWSCLTGNWLQCNQDFTRHGRPHAPHGLMSRVETNKQLWPQKQPDINCLIMTKPPCAKNHTTAQARQGPNSSVNMCRWPSKGKYWLQMKTGLRWIVWSGLVLSTCTKNACMWETFNGLDKGLGLKQDQDWMRVF